MMFEGLKPEEQNFLQSLQDDELKMQVEMANLQAVIQQMTGATVQQVGKVGIGIRGRVLGKRVVKVVMGGWYWTRNIFAGVINSMEHLQNLSPGFLIWSQQLDLWTRDWDGGGMGGTLRQETRLKLKEIVSYLEIEQLQAKIIQSIKENYTH